MSGEVISECHEPLSSEVLYIHTDPKKNGRNVSIDSRIHNGHGAEEVILSKMELYAPEVKKVAGNILTENSINRIIDNLLLALTVISSPNTCIEVIIIFSLLYNNDNAFIHSCSNLMLRLLLHIRSLQGEALSGCNYGVVNKVNNNTICNLLLLFIAMHDSGSFVFFLFISDRMPVRIDYIISPPMPIAPRAPHRCSVSICARPFFTIAACVSAWQVHRQRHR